MAQSVGFTKPRALIVDDEQSICKSLAGVLSDEGWDSVTACSGLDGLREFRRGSFDLVLLDVWMEQMDGIETLQKMKELNDFVPVVIMSGHATVETAVKATKLGAFDFLEKPLSLEKLLPIIEHAAKHRQSRRPGALFRPGHYELIGHSEAAAALHRQIKVVAPRNSWVLVTGENGSGKEVVARNIHLHSLRAQKPFVAVNCAAIPEELIESELFGHVKGAFTNALSLRRGKFELAHHGTLFLDEIADMSLKTQAKILRILQEQSFERLGDVQSMSVDVRVIAATNKNLQEEIKKGLFREDLYYRLNVIPIHVQPLRARKEDIAVLADHFLNLLARELKEEKKELSNDCLSFFEEYAWPGNIRELRNLIERLSILVPGRRITPADLPEPLLPKSVNTSSVNESKHTAQLSLKKARSSFEKAFITEQLEAFDWNISKTAEAIGVERSNLHKKLRIYGIDTRRIKL